MIEYSDSRTLPFAASQVYDVVADVKSYAEFLPWCVASRVRKQSTTAMEADVVIGYGPFRETFSSEVHLVPKSKIHVKYMQGPFDSLSNEWNFIPEGEGLTRVTFHVAFSFKNKLLEKVVRSVFEVACRDIIMAFEKRLESLNNT